MIKMILGEEYCTRDPRKVYAFRFSVPSVLPRFGHRESASLTIDRMLGPRSSIFIIIIILFQNSTTRILSGKFKVFVSCAVALA